MDYKYRIKGSKYARDLKGQVWDEEDINQLAEEAAENHWEYYDGWESSWPITFEILTENGDLIGSREVSVEMQPVFTSC